MNALTNEEATRLHQAGAAQLRHAIDHGSAMPVDLGYISAHFAMVPGGGKGSSITIWRHDNGQFFAMKRTGGHKGLVTFINR